VPFVPSSQKPLSGVVPFVGPPEKTPVRGGVIWAQPETGTGDRDRTRWPHLCARIRYYGPSKRFLFQRTERKTPGVPVFHREMQIVGKQPYRYIPAGMIGRIRSGICRIVAASFASLFSRFRLHASSCLRQQRSNRRQSSNYLSQDPMDREHQETKPAYTHTAEEAGL
jgi:hypothetical protein